MKGLGARAVVEDGDAHACVAALGEALLQHAVHTPAEVIGPVLVVDEVQVGEQPVEASTDTGPHCHDAEAHGEEGHHALVARAAEEPEHELVGVHPLLLRLCQPGLQHRLESL